MGWKRGLPQNMIHFGSSMADVQENMAKLSKADRAAIAAYLKSGNSDCWKTLRID